jgi:hypothetical protein
MIALPDGKCCGTCAFWKLPDLHATKAYGNVGTCSVMTSDLCLPFWSREVMCRTKSYEGKECDAWAVTRK